MTAAFDDPLPERGELPPEPRADELPELRADELRLREEADDDPLRDALDFGRLRALEEVPFREEPLFEAPLLDDPLRLPLPELPRLFGLDPFELVVELFFLVPDRELAWAIFPPWSNAPR